MGEMRRVTAINNGTVIDHIPAGAALGVLRMLGIGGERASPISLVMNVPSSKHGRKDIIKVEDRELTQPELDRLALIAPHASVAIIRATWVRSCPDVGSSRRRTSGSQHRAAPTAVRSRCPRDKAWGGR